MDYEVFYSGLTDLFEGVALDAVDVNQAFEEYCRGIAAIAGQIHLARIDSSLSSVEDFYGNDIIRYPLRWEFEPTEAPDEKAVKIQFKRSGYEKGLVLLYPATDHEWTQEEMRTLRAVSKIAALIISRANMQSMISQIPFTDSMTGVLNGQGLQRFGRKLDEQGELGRYAGIFLNMKNYRMINDRYGNRAGDDALRQIAVALRKRIHPEQEYMCRLGGDNFFLLVRREHVERLVAQLHEEGISCKIQDGNQIRDVCIRVRMGINIARTHESIYQIMDDASIAMATSRKNREDVVYFTEELMYRAMLRKKIVARFPEALRRGELEAFYQPKVSRKDYRLCGCEALARWRVDGVVHMPAEFIPALEEAGLMIQLDFHILEQVCRDIRSWLDEGITPVRVSVNYSKRDLMEENLAERTLEVIRRWKIDPRYVEIEFTETTGDVDVGLLSAFVRQMRSSGVTVSMDDFGTGYSSVNLFKSMDFHVVKLDRSFIQNIDRHIIKDEVILENVIQMLHELNCEIVAEGVETERQMGFLRNTACQVIQGFYFDQPMPRQEFVARLVNPQYSDMKEIRR